jgi:hypothetical protein
MSLTGADQQVGVTALSRRVVITCAAFAVVGSLGLVTNLSGQLRGPLSARTGPLFIVLMLLVPLVGMAALWRFPRRAWAWLLLAGAVVAAPTAFLSGTFSTRQASVGDQLLAVSSLTSPTLTLLGLLATATWIARAGMRGLGAVVAGLSVGVPLIGQLVVFPMFAADDRTVWAVITVIALCGAVALMTMQRSVPGDVVATTRPELRLVIAGAVCTLLPLVYALADRDSWPIYTVAALTVVATAATGWRAGLGAAIVALASTATLTPMLQVTFLAGYGSLGWTTVAVIGGILLGTVIVAGRYRVPVAAVGLVVFGALTLINPMTLRYAPFAAMVVLMFLLVAVIVAKTGAVVDLLRVDGSAAVAVSVVGASLTSALTNFEFTVGRGAYTIMNPNQGLSIAFGLMLVAAAGLLVLLSRRTRDHVE